MTDNVTEETTTFTAEEREIVAALRSCPESALSREFPPDAALALVSVAALTGLDYPTTRRALSSALNKITRAIEADPAFLHLVAIYYNLEGKF